ncbi:Ribokinase [Streptomyces hirsutus]
MPSGPWIDAWVLLARRRRRPPSDSGCSSWPAPPGLRSLLPMRRVRPDVRAGLDRDAAAMVLRDRAVEVAGVRSARVRVTRRRADVRAVSHFREFFDPHPEAAVAAALRAGRRAGTTTLLNPAPARPLPDDLWPLIDVITPNQTEAPVLLGLQEGHGLDDGELTRRLCALTGGAAVLTRGGEGALVAQAGATTRIPPHPAESVVDTTGAGDVLHRRARRVPRRGTPPHRGGAHRRGGRRPHRDHRRGRSRTADPRPAE